RISMAVRKEVHFFDKKKSINKFELWKYHTFFEFWRRKKLYGEVTPCYMPCLDAIKLIVNYNPDIKLIVSLRDPVERAYSAWNMEKQRGRESRSFSEVVKDEISLLEDCRQFLDLREYY